jgi:RNA polymerase sigma-70 factor, ECF subfamily
MTTKREAVIAELPKLRRYAMALLGDPGRADDLVQDTVERALSRLQLWKSGTNMRSWLFTIMHNLHVNAVRKQISRGREVEINDYDSAFSRRAEQPARIEMIEVSKALQQISDDQRQVLLLVVLEGLSYQEVSDVTGVAIGTVMLRLSRAREKLRTIVDGENAPILRRVK